MVANKVQYEVVIKMNNMLFKVLNNELFNHFNWFNFSAGDDVFVSELFSDAECKVKSVNQLKNRVVLEFAPVLAEEVNQFLKNVKCVGIC